MKKQETSAKPTPPQQTNLWKAWSPSPFVCLSCCVCCWIPIVIPPPVCFCCHLKIFASQINKSWVAPPTGLPTFFFNQLAPAFRGVTCVVLFLMLVFMSDTPVVASLSTSQWFSFWHQSSSLCPISILPWPIIFSLLGLFHKNSLGLSTEIFWAFSGDFLDSLLDFWVIFFKNLLGLFNKGCFFYL
jgi:hypothetical protein